MSEPTQQNWLDTLVKVFERSTYDQDFRLLCQTDALAAIKEVSDIELPAGAKVVFAPTNADYVHSYKLPDFIGTDANTQDVVNQMVRWATLCTMIPTTV